MRALTLALVLVAVALSAVSLYRLGSARFQSGDGLSGAFGGDGDGIPLRTLHPPRPLPAFSFQDGQGQKRSLVDFRGRIVLLNVWATWCPPCREEMPSLDRLQSRMGDSGFLVLALATDQRGADAVREFYRRSGIEHLGVFVDPSGGTESVLKVPGLPTTLLIDRSGNALGARIGPAEWDREEIITYLEQVGSESL